MPNIIDSSYEILKTYYDEYLNKDEENRISTNNEPTPIGCIEEMFNKIPKELWTKKDAKIFDPCCGNGNFHLVSWHIMKKLGLDDKEILQKFYFNDINTNRLKNVKNIYGKNINITQQDFFLLPEIEDYDAIYFNPPYAKIMPDGKRTAKNHTLIRDFMSKSLKMLKPNGYIICIIPDNWMSLADRNKVIKKITSNQLIWLNIHGAKKWFPKIGSSFTWFVLQKTTAKLEFYTECIFKGKQHVSKLTSQIRDFIPLLYTSEVQSILAKTIDACNDKFPIQTSSDLHKYTKKKLISSVLKITHPYKLHHTPNQVVWAKRPHKYQDGYKVFISTTDKYKLFVDNCGMTQSIAFIRCSSKSQAENIKNILQHKLYIFLNNICRWGNFNNIRILQRFPIPKPNMGIYESFGLTKKETMFIEENI